LNRRLGADRVVELHRLLDAAIDQLEDGAESGEEED